MIRSWRAWNNVTERSRDVWPDGVWSRDLYGAVESLRPRHVERAAELERIGRRRAPFLRIDGSRENRIGFYN